MHGRGKYDKRAAQREREQGSGCLVLLIAYSGFSLVVAMYIWQAVEELSG